MKISINYFLLFAIICANSLIAQDRVDFLDAKNTLSNITSTSSLSGIGFWTPAKIEDKTITGTSYLFKNFEGLYTLINKSGNSYRLLNLNYNLKSRTLETKISKDSVFQYDLKIVDYVILGNKKYKNLENNALSGLVLEIFKGKNFDIYKQSDVKVLEGTINPMTQEKSQQDTYVISYTYYANTNGNIDKIKLNKSAILNLVKDKQTEVKEYAKANNLDFSNEIDVNIILKHYELL